MIETTSSIADGPSGPTSSVVTSFVKWLKGLGFQFISSSGDNGMDYSTNYQDTYMYHAVIYAPSEVSEDDFYKFTDDDYDDY